MGVMTMPNPIKTGAPWSGSVCGTMFLGHQQQVGAMEVARNDLLAVVASRLEGSTWDGALRMYRVQQSFAGGAGQLVGTPVPEEAEGDDSRDRCPGVSFREAAPAITLESGSAAMAWCGGDRETRSLLAVAQDTGDVQLYRVGAEADGPVSMEFVTGLSEHDDLISAVAADGKDARTLATASWDCGIRLWNLGSPAVSTLEFQGHTDHVTALAWEPGSDTLLASTSKDRTVKLWDTRAKARAGNSCTSAGVASGLTVMPLCVSWCQENNSNVLAVGLDDGSVALYDTRNMTAAPAIKRLHAASVGALAFAPPQASNSGDVLLASGGDDCHTMVNEVLLGGNGDARKGAPAWSSGSARRRSVDVTEHRDYVRALCWVPQPAGSESMLLLTAGWDGHIHAQAVTQGSALRSEIITTASGGLIASPRSLAASPRSGGSE